MAKVILVAICLIILPFLGNALAHEDSEHWTLLVWSDARLTEVEIFNRDACINAGKGLKRHLVGFFFCLNKGTGEVFRVKNKTQ